MLRIFSVLLAFCLPSAALAGSMQISPTFLDLSVSRAAATLQLQNLGNEKVNIQARVFKWTQANGKDVLTPTDNVVVSPPAAAMTPGQSYTLRVVHRSGAKGDTEEAYRLVVDELPAVNVKRPAGAVSMVVRQSLPVFFSKPSAAADLTWRIRQAKSGYLLEGANGGTRHAKIANLKVGSTVVKNGLAGYILPGSSRQWPLGGKLKLIPGSTVEITAKGSDYGVKASARVED